MGTFVIIVTVIGALFVIAVLAGKPGPPENFPRDDE